MLISNLKSKLATLAWDTLVRISRGQNTISIYGFGDGSWNRKLAGKIMCSSWWPVEEYEDVEVK